MEFSLPGYPDEQAPNLFPGFSKTRPPEALSLNGTEAYRYSIDVGKAPSN
jgi:hypothetical protein